MLSPMLKPGDVIRLSSSERKGTVGDIKYLEPDGNVSYQINWDSVAAGKKYELDRNVMETLAKVGGNVGDIMYPPNVLNKQFFEWSSRYLSSTDPNFCCLNEDDIRDKNLEKSCSCCMRRPGDWRDEFISESNRRTYKNARVISYTQVYRVRSPEVYNLKETDTGLSIAQLPKIVQEAVELHMVYSPMLFEESSESFARKLRNILPKNCNLRGNVLTVREETLHKCFDTADTISFVLEESQAQRQKMMSWDDLSNMVTQSWIRGPDNSFFASNAIYKKLTMRKKKNG